MRAATPLPAGRIPSAPDRRGSRLAIAFTALLCTIATGFALTLPALSGRVVDRANIISTETRTAIEQKLADLEYGQYISYGELGLEIGRPGSGRAIGGAVGANPIPIIIGCHRVLASNGKITGYSGGEGIPTKLWLLTHEGIMLAA